MRKLGGIDWPPLRDPRYLQCGALTLYAVAAREVFHFDRSHAVTVACVGWAIALDLLLGKFWYHRVQAPLSAIIVGLASSILLDAREAWPYLLAATLGVLSKALIRGEGKHLFNPGNFGVVVLLQLAAPWVTGMQDLFVDAWIPSAAFATLGLFVAGYARRLSVALSWIAGFLIFGGFRSWFVPMPLRLALVPALGPAFLLFSFHMITDPATTPRTARWSIAFGLAVAAIDAGFRVAQIPYGTFYALFLMCAFLPWLREVEAPENLNIQGS